MNPVIEFGIPDPPEVFEVGMSVPIARWVDNRFAAVLHVSWGGGPDEEDDEDDDGEYELYSDVEEFIRRGDRWEPSNGRGGSGWHPDPFSRPSMLPSDSWVGGEHCSWEWDGEEWGACATYGVVGTAITELELRRGDEVIRRPVESKAGAVVAVTSAEQPATLLSLLADGAVVGSATFGGHDGSG